MDSVHVVIMAGGSGTRFWPWSRGRTPKHILDICEGRSLLAGTVDRVSSMIPVENVFVVTTSSQVDIVKDAVSDVPPENIIAEPYGRDTAPCIGLAAVIIRERRGESVMAVMPADHVISPNEKFCKALGAAVSLASESGTLITFGITPIRPSVHYGYVHCGQKRMEIDGEYVYDAVEFREKPDMDTAREYFDSGGYYWNSGIFVWSTGAILSSMERYMPRLAAGLSRIADSVDTEDAAAVIEREYKGFEKISIDYGIMEKAEDVAVIETDFHWDDVGTWKAVERLNSQDDAGNTLLAEHVGINTDGCIVVGKEGRLITTANVSDLIIVQTDEVTLICDKNRDEDVKDLVRKLGDMGLHGYL